MAKLLMLKEYLELDDDDDGFVLGVGVATIRSLLDAELRRESALRNAACGAGAANGNVLGKFSAAIEAVKARCLPLSSRPERATFSALFWKKKKKDKKRRQGLTADQNASDAVGWHSLRFPSPVISSRPSHCSYAASPAPYYLQVTSSTGEERKEHSPPQSSSSQPSGNEEATSTTATLSPATEFDGREAEDFAENKSNDEEEKVRGSLISMMDYKNRKVRVDEEEEDEEEVFYRSLDHIERTTEKLLHRIRRFEMLAELDPPMECFSPSSDGDDDDDVSSHAEEEKEEEEELAWELLGRLKANAPRGGGEKLLLDFFTQGGKADGGLLPMRKRRREGATATTTEMLLTARRWIDGRPGGDEDCGHGEAATLREMERDGRWRCFHEEEDELALGFGDAMLQLLLEELVKELASQL